MPNKRSRTRDRLKTAMPLCGFDKQFFRKAMDFF
jgi:hypothetical protein